MPLSVFSDKSKQPQDADLAATLGNAFMIWNQLKTLISERFAPTLIEWGFSSPKTGWGLRLKHKDRTILYMTPCRDYFLVSFALGEKAVKALHESDLPAPILDAVDNAKKYAEGRGVRLEVKTVRDVHNIEKIAVAKMKN